MRTTWIAALCLVLAGMMACGSGKGSLYGQIREAAGPVEAAEVLIINSSNDVVQKTITGSGGKFVVRGQLQPGTYVAEARHPGYQTVRQTFTYPETSSLDLTMASQVKVQGIVRMQDKSVAPQAILSFQNQKGEKVKTVADESGSYVVPGLNPGEYTLEAITPDGSSGYTAKMTFTADQKVVELEIVLGSVKTTATGENMGVERPIAPQGIEVPTNN